MGLVKSDEVEQYLREWDGWCVEKGLKELRLMSPTAIGWKVADLGAFAAEASELIKASKQVHCGNVDGRKIGSFLLDTPIAGVPIVKLMQRRPGSDDPVGLDHIDFFIDDPRFAELRLREVGATFERQRNEAHKWLSVRFGSDGREAKIVDHLVLDVCAHELRQAGEELMEEL